MASPGRLWSTAQLARLLSFRLQQAISPCAAGWDCGLAAHARQSRTQMEPTNAPGAETARSQTGYMKSPLLLVAASFALGVFLAVSGRAHGFALAVLPACAAACLLAGLLVLRAGWERVSLLLALLGFVTAGACAGCFFECRFPPNHVSKLAAQGVDLQNPLRLQGRVISTPLRTAYGLQFDLETERAGSGKSSRQLT